MSAIKMIVKVRISAEDTYAPLGTILGWLEQHPLPSDAWIDLPHGEPVPPEYTELRQVYEVFPDLRAVSSIDK